METVRFPITIKVFSSQTYAFATQWKNKTNSFFCRLRDRNTSSSSATHQLVSRKPCGTTAVTLFFHGNQAIGRTLKYRKNSSPKSQIISGETGAKDTPLNLRRIIPRASCRLQEALGQTVPDPHGLVQSFLKPQQNTDPVSVTGELERSFVTRRGSGEENFPSETRRGDTSLGASATPKLSVIHNIVRSSSRSRK